MIGIIVLVFCFDIVTLGVNAQFRLERSKCEDLCPGIDLNNVDLHAVKYFSRRITLIKKSNFSS